MFKVGDLVWCTCCDGQCDNNGVGKITGLESNNRYEYLLLKDEILKISNGICLKLLTDDEKVKLL